MDALEVIETCRAIRYLKPDPVPDEMIIELLDAAIRAPNGGNHQTWHFVVVKDMAIKQAVQFWYQKAYDEIIGPRYASEAPPPGSDAARYHRQHLAVEYLTHHFHEAPVWIVACIDHGSQPPDRMSGASIYPAVQNILLAARAMGLGANLTTRHLFFEKEAEAALELPPGVHSYAIVPIGYPMGNFGPLGRGDLKDFVSLDRVGTPWDAIS